MRLRFPNVHLVLALKPNVSLGDGITGVELPSQKMNLLYRCADALVHPALYYPYPLAVHEALVNGLPVILGRNTGNAHYAPIGGWTLSSSPGSGAPRSSLHLPK